MFVKFGVIYVLGSNLSLNSFIGCLTANQGDWASNSYFEKNNSVCFKMIFLIFSGGYASSDESVAEKHVTLGSKVELQCPSSLRPPVTYSWSKKQGAIDTKAVIKGVRVFKSALTNLF